jgi:hypothetical protein
MSARGHERRFSHVRIADGFRRYRTCACSPPPGTAGAKFVCSAALAGADVSIDRSPLCDAKTPHALGVPSVLHAKNNLHDTLHFIELLRIQVVGDLDVFVVGSGDFKREACVGELD